MAEVDPAVAVDLQSLVSNDTPVVTLPDAARGSAIAAYLQERGVHKAMLAMLPGEDRVIGTLMLSNRYGVVRDFSSRRPQAVRDAGQQRLASRCSTTASSRRSRGSRTSSSSSATRPSTTR